MTTNISQKDNADYAFGAVVRLSANQLRWLINQLEGRTKDHSIYEYGAIDLRAQVLNTLEKEEARATAAIANYMKVYTEGTAYTPNELKQIHDSREK